MAYIGRGTENISNVEVLDNLTFDGSASYTLQKSSTNFVPSSANNLLISISGVVQQGNFSVSGSTITFDTTVSSSDTCDWILHYGTGLITTVADGAITEAKLGNGAVTNAKLANSSITLNGSAVSLGGSATIDGGKIGQVVSGTYSTLTTMDSSTFADTGISLSITPSAASSKIFISIQNSAGLQRSNQEVGGKFRILRDATAIWTGAGQTFYQGAFGSVSANEMSATQTFNYLDSPSTTSATTYKLQQASNGGGHNIKSQLGNTPSIITLMEVLA
jgi:hypothetical protein